MDGAGTGLEAHELERAASLLPRCAPPVLRELVVYCLLPPERVETCVRRACLGAQVEQAPARRSAALRPLRTCGEARRWRRARS